MCFSCGEEESEGTAAIETVSSPRFSDKKLWSDVLVQIAPGSGVRKLASMIRAIEARVAFPRAPLMGRLRPSLGSAYPSPRQDWGGNCVQGREPNQ